MQPPFSRRDLQLWRMISAAVVVGALVGLLVVAYRLLLTCGLSLARAGYAAVRDRPVLLPLWALAAVTVALLILAALRLVPTATGSGIPQIKGILVYRMRMPAARTIAARFFAGGLGSVAGLSLGREGPCVQIGGSVGQLAGQSLKTDDLERDQLITAGAAAGLSAAFNAPLSGAVFALEELHRSFSPVLLLVAITATLSADVTSASLLGLDPVLQFGSAARLALHSYPWLLALGAAAGVVAAGSNLSLLAGQRLLQRIPASARLLLAVTVALAVGLGAPSLLGGGEGLVTLARSTATPAIVLAALMLGKIVFTSTSFGSGTPGGVFMPLLAVGALTGAVFAHATSQPAAATSALVLCGMAGVLSGALQAPVTAILLVLEMSGQVTAMLPAGICALTALLVADLLRGQPLYDVLLERLTAGWHDDVATPRSTVMAVTVESRSPADGSPVRDLALPDGVRLVEVRRGLGTLDPSEETVLRTGDRVVVAATASGPATLRGVRGSARRLFHSPESRYPR